LPHSSHANIPVLVSSWIFTSFSSAGLASMLKQNSDADFPFSLLPPPSAVDVGSAGVGGGVGGFVGASLLSFAPGFLKHQNFAVSS